MPLIGKINKKSLAEQGDFVYFPILWYDSTCLLTAKNELKRKNKKLACLVLTDQCSGMRNRSGSFKRFCDVII